MQPQGMSPVQSALQAALGSMPQAGAGQIQQPQANPNPFLAAMQGGAGQVGQAVGGAVGQGVGDLAGALKNDPRYQQAIGQIGNFLSLIGHPLAGAFNQYHGLGAGGQAAQGAGNMTNGGPQESQTQQAFQQAQQNLGNNFQQQQAALQKLNGGK